MDKRHFLFLNIGHFLDHFFILIFATAAALSLVTEWQLSYAELIPYSMAGFIAFGLFSLPSGWLADKWSREGMILVFFVGIGLTSIGASTAQSPLEIAIWLFAVGIFASIYHPKGAKGFKERHGERPLMGECELCGAVKVGVRQVRTGKTEVLACSRCIEKLNLGPKGEAPGLQQARRSGSPSSTRKNDLMSKGAKELAPDFHKRIAKARGGLNWTQMQLAKKMAETINVIKAAESGKRPTDAVIRKFESIILNFSLYSYI